MKKTSSVIIISIIYSIIWIILFIVPIFFAPILLTPFLATKTFLFILLVEIATFFYLYHIIFNKEYRPKNNYILFSFLFFILISFISGILGADPIFSFWSSSIRFDGIILLIHIFLFFLIIAFTVKTKKILNKLIWSSVISSLLVSLSVYLVYFDNINLGILTKIFNGQAQGGTIGNDSFTGAYLLFNLFLIIYLFFDTQIRKNKYIIGIIFILIILNPIFFNFKIFTGLYSINNLFHNPMLLIGSARGATISLGISLILTILFFLSNKNYNKINFYIKILIKIFVVFLSIITILIFIQGSSVNKWLGDKTGGYRFIYWHQAVEGFKDRPILGWGPGNFVLINEKYFDPIVINNDYLSGEKYSDKAHSIIFDTVSTTGIIGLISYLSIFITSLILLWKSDKILFKVKAIFTSLLLSYFLQNLIFFDVLVSYMMFAFILAIIVIMERGFSDSKDYELIPASFFKRNIIFVILLFLFIFLIRYLAFLPFKESYFNYRFYNLPWTVRGYYKENRNFSDFGTSRDVEKYALSVLNVYLTNIDSLKKQNDNRIYINDIDNIIEDIIENSKKTGVTYFGSHLIFQFYDIEYQFTKNDLLLPKMREYSEKEILLSPNNISGYIDNARVFYYENNYIESASVIERAINISPANDRLYLILLEVAMNIKDKKILKEKIERVKINLPTYNLNINF